MTNHHPYTTVIFLIITTTATFADDAAIMSKLAASISPTPSTWQTQASFCTWEGVSCDNEQRVTSIYLPSKSLTGSLPPDLNNLSNLKTLALQRNKLSGPLPTLSNLTLLETMMLDSNNFSMIPDRFFTGLSNLETFSISDNLDLSSWILPRGVTECGNLKTFDASNANMFGEIPDVFEELPNLQNLRLSYNNLTGGLPASFGGSEIVNLWLNNQAQGLSGNIDVIGLMTEVSQVWLQANEFSGVIPDLSKCVNLFDLHLRDNMFTGLFPVADVALPKLVNITLQNNKLLGPMPVFGNGVKVELGVGANSFCLDKPGDCDAQVMSLLAVAGDLGYPMSLAESWKGNDACGEWEFVSCDSNKRVTTLNLGKKNFSGTISPALGNLTLLRSLSLNDNNLVGEIPGILVSLPDLEFLDVSNNNLSGPIPEFSPKVKFLYANNPILGVNITSGNVKPPGSASMSSVSEGRLAKHSKGSSVALVVGIVMSVILFFPFVIVLFVGYKCYIKNRHRKFGKVGNPESGKESATESGKESATERVMGSSSNRYGKEVLKESVTGSSSNCYGVFSELQSQSSGDHSEMLVMEGGMMISVQVLRQVTDNFSDNNVLGRGGFGVVYKGELQDGTNIAVKRMESGVKGTKVMNEFQAEIGVLTKVRHRHLVALLGYCANDNERLLVYEYMPQGTLSQHLFDWNERKSPPLSWKQRVSIALDVGRGVEYLHSLAQQSFIHRDLKPSNILLGDDMRAKVADFGLVKNAHDARGGKVSIETKVAGTFGYLAPEYAATGRVTTKVDVYAFGVVLMELITGRKALDDTMPDERCHLVSWFRRVIIAKENIVKSIDQMLDTNDEETLESIIKVAELAGHCTAREPFQRPDMGHAVIILGPLVEQWKPSRQEEVEETYSHRMSLPEVLQRWQAGEGSSQTFDMSFSQTQSSIPTKPSGFPDTFNSSNCR